MTRNFELVRKMGDFNVLQRTMDGMFNATALLKQWNGVSKSEKYIADFLKLKNTKEFIDALCDELLEKSEIHNSLKINCGEKSVIDYQEVIKTKKGGASSTGIKPDEVWMHPLLFIKFACWLNPRFEVKVLSFVQDQLIMYRNRIADSHRKWTDMLQQLGCKDSQYSKLQREMNLAVFGNSYDGIRNFASEEQLLKMSNLENAIEQAVQFGLITDLTGVGSYLRKVYEQDFPSLNP